MSARQIAIETTVPGGKGSNPLATIALRAVAAESIDNYVGEYFGAYGEFSREELEDLLALLPEIPSQDPGWAGTLKNRHYHLRQRFEAMLNELIP